MAHFLLIPQDNYLAYCAHIQKPSLPIIGTTCPSELSFGFLLQALSSLQYKQGRVLGWIRKYLWMRLIRRRFGANNIGRIRGEGGAVG